MMDTDPKLLELIKNEFPILSKHQITYLDHAGASLYAESQIKSVSKDLTENLLANPHTNFGHLQVITSCALLRSPALSCAPPAICYRDIASH